MLLFFYLARFILLSFDHVKFFYCLIVYRMYVYFSEKKSTELRDLYLGHNTNAW